MSYFINENCLKTNWFNVVDTVQPISPDIKLTYCLTMLEDIHYMLGVDPVAEMKQVTDYEIMMSVQQYILKRIMNSVDVYDIKTLKLTSKTAIKREFKKFSFDECTHTVMSPMVLAMTERMLKLKYNNDSVDFTVGISNIGYINETSILRDTLCPRDYMLNLSWDKQPIIDVNIADIDSVLNEETNSYEIQITVSDFDPTSLKPELTLIDISNVINKEKSSRIFLY